MDCGVDVDLANYCRQLSDLNTQRRPMVERYFVRRYKCGIYDFFVFCCYFIKSVESNDDG